MTINGKAYIAGAFEHPTRHAPDKTVAQLHAEVALGALADAGLAREDVDGYFCSGDAPGPGPASMAEYMNLKTSPRRVRPSLAARLTSRWPPMRPKRLLPANATWR